jgi:HEPN domain-containing protein
MKTRADLVKGWLRKAESDLANAELCLPSGRALDTVCFHAQQAAERYLKAYLTAWDLECPFIHNLEKLIELCSHRDPEFLGLRPLGQTLTPYAVELRYDEEFWPSADTARQALEAARAVRDFVARRLPAGMTPAET